MSARRLEGRVTMQNAGSVPRSATSPDRAPSHRRRLAAILFADVAGYSRLMAGNEIGTLSALREHRSLFETVAAACGGRVVNTAGDSILAEFSSVIAAIACALRFQALSGSAPGGPATCDSGIRFRVGVHVGDVVREAEQIYGDAVNIAARLQALAEPGGVCVSRAVRDQVRDKLAVSFHDAGEQSVKNITRPVRVFHVLPGEVGRAAETISDQLLAGLGTDHSPTAGRKPRVAVLPFACESGTPDYAYFSYGLTEDVIRLLGRSRWLDVLTRHSTQPFQGSRLSVREIGDALNARYLVEGSFSKRGDHVRIAVELIETQSERQLWSEVYAFDLDDIFDIHEEMARQIAATIEPELGSVEQEVAARKHPGNLDAWDCYQRGFWHLWFFTGEGFSTAEELFRKAIGIDPALARAQAALSYVQLQECFYAEPPERPRLLASALESAEAAVRLDERDSVCHCVLGRALCLSGRYGEAIAALEKTIELNPSFAQGYFALAFACVFCRREEEAIALVERALDLSPRDPHRWTFYHVRSMAHFALDELGQAEFFSRKAIAQSNATYFPYTALVSLLGLQARVEEAEQARDLLLKKKPGYSLSLMRADFAYCANEEFRSRFEEGLRRAGVE